MAILINIVGSLIIVLIIWWFWFSKPKAMATTTNHLIEINVKNGIYNPALIQARINETITLRFIREDASPCAEVVNFSRLNISKTLPLHTPVDIQLTIPQAGEYEFACSMGMYRGKLVVT
jgi:plastocyanin domain-containing protein